MTLMLVLLSALAFLLLLIVLACGLVVLLTHVTAWYEYANARPELVQQRFQAQHWRPAVLSMLKEWLILTHLVLLWPLGLLPPQRRRMPASAVPVVLVHGLFQNCSCWWWFAYKLRRLGHRHVLCFTLSPWHNIEAATELLAKQIDRLRHRHGIRRVALVGHSMGGVLARNYIQLRGGADKVAAVVQLGSPNAGSRLAPFAVTPLGLALLPGSEFLQRLKMAPLPAECPITSIYSRRDNMVLPYTSSHLPGARNIELEAPAHNSLLFHDRALQLVHRQLREAGA
jgi:pimeloyl-ACP methyl ester carboxylesterase